MNIPVFVSSPTSLSPSQEAARTVIIRQLEDNDLEARALGRSDYPTELPLREVLLIARHCSGGIILGFEQFRASGGLKKPGTSAEEQISTSVPSPHSVEPFGVRHSFRALLTPSSIPRTRHHFRCFHSSYAATTHQRRCEGCAEAGFSEMGGEGSRTLL
jgi:hypothetical protein